MGKAIVTALAVSALLCAGCATTEEASGSGFVSAQLFGMVYDGDNQPCPDVRISVDGVEGPVTDIRGRFLVPALSRGAHEVKARKAGFEELTASFSFRSRTDVMYLRLTSLAQLLSMAEEALEARRWEEAEAFLARARKLDSADPVLMYLNAVRWYRMERWAEAASGLEAMLSAGLKDASVYVFLADLYEGPLKDPAKARGYLEAFLAVRWDADAERRWKALQPTAPAP